VKLAILIAALLGCSPRHAAQVAQPIASVSADCAAGGDDTLAVQTAMGAGACLAAGTYNVDAPVLNAVGRRRDSMLTGTILCGVQAGRTTIRFRGDAHALLWAGVTLTSGGFLHDITLDSTCLTNTIEQSHLVRMVSATNHVAIRDAAFVHPPRTDGSRSGDCINVVGSMTAPNVGLEIDHNTFAACKRIGVQLTRGASDVVIADNQFTACGSDIGSEGSGALANIVIRHNVFSAGADPHGYSLELERMTGVIVDHNVITGRPVLLYVVDDAALTGNIIANRVMTSSAIRIGDIAHRVHMTNNTVSQPTGSLLPGITISPLGANRQADLADFTVESCSLEQGGAQGFASLAGVGGFALTRSSLTFTGPASPAPSSVVATASGGTPPAISVLTTGVVETDNIHIGFP